MTELPRDAGPRRRWREVDGIVLLDKPAGLSSNQALQQVRRLLRAAKAGHAGTLDPMATGMLPLCFGQATKACGQLLGHAKSYRATLRFGSETDTGDAEGSVLASAPVPALEPDRVRRVLATLVGDRMQVPPMYSALKRDGRPLYELARRGEVVERAARPVHIGRLELLRLDRHEIEFEVDCSTGTYVRVLGTEIAAALGTVGHLGALRRLWVQPFQRHPMVTLPEIERWASSEESMGTPPHWLLPVDSGFDGLPSIALDAVQSLHLRQGRALGTPPGVEPGTVLRVYEGAGRFLGLAEAGPDGLLRVRRLFVAGAGSAGPDET